VTAAFTLRPQPGPGLSPPAQPWSARRREPSTGWGGAFPGVGIAVTGTILAALFTGDIATSSWSAQQTAEFREAVTIAGPVPAGD
jgi:hypothetical protein